MRFPTLIVPALALSLAACDRGSDAPDIDTGNHVLMFGNNR